jgi:hypothetical protein
MPYFTLALSARVENGTLVLYGLVDSQHVTGARWTECNFQLFKTEEPCIRICAIKDAPYVFVDTVELDGEVFHLFIDHNFTTKKAFV